MAAVDLGTGVVSAAARCSTTSFRIGDKQQTFVSQGSDDATQTGTAVNVTSTSALLTNSRTSGFRFTSVNIPKNSVITKATLSFVCSDTKHNDFNFTAWCEAADNSATFTTAASSITSRSRTTASQSVVALNTFTDTSTYFTSPDVSAPVQEVINRSGWSLSNALTFIISGNDGANNLLSKTFEASAPARLDVVWIPPAQTIALAGAANAAGTATGTINRSLALTPQVVSAVGAVRTSKTTTINWDGNDLATQFIVDAITQDESPLGTILDSTFNMAETGNAGTFWLDPWNDVGGTRSYSNRRDWLVWQGTDTFKDGTVRVLYDPPRFAGGAAPTSYRPQHGITGRWVDNTDHHLGITVWHDITVPFPAVQNFGVWRTERPLTGLSTTTDPPNSVRRTTANTPGFGLTGGTFPYWAEVEFSGEKVRVRVWVDGGSPPDWDSSISAAARDLSEAATPGSGSNAYSRTPTPTQGKVAIMIGHISALHQSVARVREFSVTQWDALDVAQDLGVGSVDAAATLTGSLDVARPLTGSAIDVAAEVSSFLAIDKPLVAASTDAAAEVNGFLELAIELLPQGSDVAAEIVGVLTVDTPEEPLPTLPDQTLTAIEDPLTLESVGEPLTLVAIED